MQPWTAEQFTEINAQNSEQQQLTSIDLIETVDHVDIEQRSIQVDPYPDITPTKLLTRRYLIDSIIMEPTNHNNVVIEPYRLLLNVPGVKHALKGFKYFSADLEMKIVLSANKNLYGTIVLGTLPQVVKPTPNHYSHVNQLLQMDPHLLDVGRQESIELRLPFLHTKRLTKTSDLSNTFFQLWQVRMQLLGLQSIFSDTPLQVKVDIWANFIDPKCSGLLEGHYQSWVGHRRPDFMSRIAHFVNDVGQLARANPFQAIGLTGATAATTAALGAVSSAAKTADTFNRFVTYNKKDEVKPTICPDLNGTGSTSFSFLGDRIRGSKNHLPSFRNVYDISQILSTPSHAYDATLLEQPSNFVFSVDPVHTHSYLQYFMRCFKYWHTDVDVMIRFVCPQDMTFKATIVLLPTGTETVSVSWGDLPNWNVAIKGTTDFCCRVPWMEEHHWLDTDTSLRPKMQISITQDITQVYDVDVPCFVHIFTKPVNTSLGSLQSPCNASTQMTFEEAFSDVTSFGSQYDSEFMGGYRSVYDLLSRFSSRNANLDNMFPFPRTLTSELWQYDLYDYLSQLYTAYTGSVDVKYMLTGNAPPGLIKFVTGNSHDESVHGNKFKASNSMVLTSQSLWPVLELNFPYERNDEFCLLDSPSPHYIPETNFIEGVSEIFIRPGPDFQFFTLRPTPDWADGNYAVFQSYRPRWIGFKNVAGFATMSEDEVSNHSLNSVDISNKAFMARISVDCIRISGSDPITLVGNFSNVAPTTFNNVIVHGFLPFRVVLPSGVSHNSVHVEKFISITEPVEGCFVNMATHSTDANTSVSVQWTLEIYPFGSSVVPTDPSSNFFTNTIELKSQSGPVGVSLDIEALPVTFNEPVEVCGVARSYSPGDYLPVWTVPYKPSTY